MEFYRIEKYVYLGNGISEYQHKLNVGESVHYSDIKPDKNGDYCIPSRLLCFGDYSNSCLVEGSNSQVFLDEFKGNIRIWNVTGEYGSSGILMHRDLLENERIKEYLDALEDYPLLDDEHYSQLCWDSYFEAWNDYGISDFIRSLKSEFKFGDRIGDFLECIDSDTLMEFYESLLPSGEFYIDESATGVSLLCDYAAKNCSTSKLAQFIINERAKQNTPRKITCNDFQLGMFLPPSKTN